MAKRVKKAGAEVQLVIVGSVGLDTIETSRGRRDNLLGGSVSYACAAASFFAPVGMVGVVGDDFLADHIGLYRDFGIDVEGLQQVAGRTFRWSGVYEADMINRRTLSTELNVFADFSPDLPAQYRKSPFLLLGNISPDLQLHVLSQMERPRFVAADTMDLWINIARPKLLKVIRKVQALMINDSEARLLTGEHNLKKAAAAILRMGPHYVVVKKGEHGAMLATRRGIFLYPAYPVDDVMDPTGAGDTFAGGFMGYLARDGRKPALQEIRDGLLAGTVVASFGVEAFSLDRLVELRQSDIAARTRELRRMALW
jgi:sugar/nucleoside kinase (ribokinase family)